MRAMKTKPSSRRSRWTSEAAANDKLPLLTKAEIAKHLRFTTRTVEHWLTRGLPHLRLGNRATRFRVRDVEDFFEAQYGDMDCDSKKSRSRHAAKPNGDTRSTKNAKLNPQVIQA
jgi:hypothetical protein